LTTARLLPCLLLAFATANAAAQAPASPAPVQQQRKPEPPTRVPAELASFFTGEWSGRGQFASGRPIEADVSFHPELDGQWLQYRHTDRAPNSYKALGMWGIENSSRKLVMTLNDSGGGARTFTSGGWGDGSVIFVRTISTDPLREERFVFRRIGDQSFHMAYEVHAGEQPWRMIDQLTFERRLSPKPAAE
jgi:hypothetical protein